MASRGKTDFDYTLLLIVATLLALGLVMVFSASYERAPDLEVSPIYFFRKQLRWALLGLTGLIVMAYFDYRVWRRWAIPIMAVTLLGLVAVLFIGSRILGSRRWLLGGSAQPSELAKIAVIIYIASWLSSRRSQLSDVTYSLVPFAVLLGLVSGLIVAQPDLSTAILVVLTVVSMFFIAGADWRQLSILFLIGAVTFALLITQSEHASTRFRIFLDSFWDPLHSENLHIRELVRALASGGVFGNGLRGGEATQPGHLPFPWSDSVFAILGEKLGLMGTLLVVGLFAALAYRGFRVGMEAPDTFGMFLAAGITCWLVFQAIINIAVVTAIAPPTGLTLPFISFGGSSLVVSLAGVGLLLSISRGRAEGNRPIHASFDLWWRDRRPRLSGSRRRTSTTRKKATKRAQPRSRTGTARRIRGKSNRSSRTTRSSKRQR
ncbi:MAG TPA: cell division protein FtsW [Anaerolineae bacterium]|nr:cell division protein FtsW [Anaerolineae bacterium]HIQ04345.1 cell division protein FtsW [Anaerolineae bacterium]